ncbi:hypothetical protein AX16_007520 [Volvariella volvacea WC 439]|nr:hypothetical protein AX16_007520 [Volvariella volvacea WC 439]
MTHLPYSSQTIHESCPWEVDQLEAFGFCATDVPEYDELLNFFKARAFMHMTSFAIEVPPLVMQDKHYPLIDLSVMPNLACLTFVAADIHSAYQHIRWTISQLQTLPPINQLREFHLWLSLIGWQTIFVTREDWAQLDNYLTDDRFKNLELLSLRARHDYGSSAEIVGALPKMMERKILQVEIVTSSPHLNENFPTLFSEYLGSRVSSI